jgi:DNA-binding transcriptional MerR regulator
MAFFRIKEASVKVGVVPHVLRFWESQFPMLKPPKTSRGQRLYSDEDIENFLKIKFLLYNQGYSISGAKKFLKEQGSQKVSHQETESVLEENLDLELIKEIRQEISQLDKTMREI